ncbi:MAG: transcription-repair coupling factor, partial [Hyphomonadaceae bacterium]|nr:transcription-repair coupling factor [Clostridia bacterium]
WTKAKTRVKASVAVLAEELIKLYAKRQASEGFAFAQDTPWQREFEDTFIYEETDDQLRSIEEVKADMEITRPMDRLLCGDVGYGKTEVAIRAAFKAVMDGKQVAYLVPTTILAQQIYNSFVQRMQNFAVKVDLLNRFRSPLQQKSTIKAVGSGKVDILIGTHRLLSKDIRFKDLGLLVIDEEQRFGVTHKEKIKDIKHNVDILTLTATPIPRTLHMSMVGIRDMSVLEEPPHNRHPVETYVLEYRKDVIRDAIVKELARDGQVYYLYNRVQGIENVAREIEQMVPEAVVGVAHGQMGEDALEEVMMKASAGEIDVLVCTTIIESGLDIPNINTMIVEDADRLGLSQLYQLRGRVGRSARRAYAYITYRKNKVLQEVAQKRLQAIKDFTEFGSGFKIAMRDLEIRGAGNLLGPEQHGHMESVGYDMYCKLLLETVQTLKGEKVEEPFETTIDLGVNAFLPKNYVPHQGQRIEMYKKIGEITDEQDVIEVQGELIDRFGDLPVVVNSLLEVAYVKSIAHQLGISAMQKREGHITFYFHDKNTLPMQAIFELVHQNKWRILFNAGDKPHISWKFSKQHDENILYNIKILLQTLKELRFV